MKEAVRDTIFVLGLLLFGVLCVAVLTTTALSTPDPELSVSSFVSVKNLAEKPSSYEGKKIVVAGYADYKGEETRIVPVINLNSGGVSLSWGFGSVNIYAIFDYEDRTGPSVEAYIQPDFVRVNGFPPFTGIPSGGKLSSKIEISGVWLLNGRQKFLSVQSFKEIK